jgi:hypothetical protein
MRFNVQIKGVRSEARGLRKKYKAQGSGLFDFRFRIESYNNFRIANLRI